MILRYGAKNFYSFKEGVEISFELPQKCPRKISKGKHESNLICVKGANGSGKTNALKILSFLGGFCTDSFNLKPEQDLMIFSFFENEDPIDLYCDFVIDGTEYSYEVSLTQNKIFIESISRTEKRKSLIIKREGNEITKCINEYKDLKRIKLRDNASLISTANQYEINSIKKFYSFFRFILSNVKWSGRRNLQQRDENVSEFYNKNSSALKFALDFIKRSDTGITDIKIHKRKDEQGEDIYFPIFTHDVDFKYNELTYYDQSSGTKELYSILPFYSLALDAGGVLVLDEFDLNLHPHILPLLVELFDKEETNPKNAQMVFTTHNESIIDYMGKYRTVLVNKEKGESYAYRMDEIPGDIIRNDRPISPLYHSGKLGGVPKI
jgi:AAA15 family ATPase/GTPase